MALTIKEKREVVHACIHGKYWPSDTEPPKNKDGSINCVQNDDLLTKEFDEKMAGQDHLTKQEYFNKLYSLIMKLREDGRFVWKTVQHVHTPLELEPVDPATTLPHENLSELRNLRTLIDVQNITAEDARKAMQPGFPKKEWEERIAYIRLHKIMTSTKNYSKKEVTKRQEINPNDGGYGEARALVAAISAKDVGSVGSTPETSAWAKADKFKARVSRFIDKQEQSGMSGPAVFKFVKTEIAALRSSSII
jgi:hypothetical protein